jgi:DnaJ homolog subfamily C member 28
MPQRYLDRRAEMEIEALLQREERERAAARTAASQPKSAVRRPGSRQASDWQSLVEQRIIDGMEQGLFDNLEGEGQPLNLDADRFVPDELKMAFRMLRSTGLAPLWVDLNREIREDLARLERFREHVHARWDGMHPIELANHRSVYEARLKSINDKILNYNIIAPSSQVHIGMLLIGEELAKFDRGPDR